MGFLNWLFGKFGFGNGKEKMEDSDGQYQNTNKQKGDRFEKYVMRKLDKNRYFVIKEVTADKGFDVGVWVEANAHPDFVVEFNWKEKGVSKLFAVECKWRKSLFQNYFCWASFEQIQRYEKFSSERQMPVFLALGLGGSPDNPSKFYVVPLDGVLEDIKELRKGYRQGAIYFKKLDNPKLGYFKPRGSEFFFDYETGILR